MSVLHLDRFTVTQAARTIAALDLSIAPGEIVTVMGPSGSGKSTLLLGLLGTLDPVFQASGAVWLGGRDVTRLPPHRRGIGLLFQDDLLFAHMNVAENLAFALPKGESRAARAARIEAALETAGLEGFGPRDPASLSGGQRSRIALMRCLLAAPQAVLLDEPFARLDADLRAQMRDFTFGHLRKARLPAILVTHDIEDAKAAGGPVLSPLGQGLAPGP